MGRLTLNVLLSFAQFEREVTAERIRDKIAASKKKGLWMGGNVPLDYEHRCVGEDDATQIHFQGSQRFPYADRRSTTSWLTRFMLA